MSTPCSNPWDCDDDGRWPEQMLDELTADAQALGLYDMGARWELTDAGREAWRGSEHLEDWPSEAYETHALYRMWKDRLDDEDGTPRSVLLIDEEWRGRVC